MPQQHRTEWSEWARHKVLEFARELNRPVDEVSFHRGENDTVVLVVHRRDKTKTYLLEPFLFTDDDNRRTALEKFLKAIVRALPPHYRRRGKGKTAASHTAHLRRVI